MGVTMGPSVPATIIVLPSLMMKIGQKMVTSVARSGHKLPKCSVDEDDVDGGAEAGDGLHLQHVGLNLLGKGKLLRQLQVKSI